MVLNLECGTFEHLGRSTIDKNQQDFQYLHGTRVGEASNPGPGGSAATSNRRDEKVAQGILGGLNLEAIVTPIIQKIVEELISKLLGDGGLMGMIAGSLGGTAPAKEPDKDKGKGKSKQKGKSKSEAMAKRDAPDSGQAKAEGRGGGPRDAAQQQLQPQPKPKQGKQGEGRR